ncbi:MAG: hypothetical protein EAX96_16000 [Candidatus Lokiarchaeota archaeon]|nr:hypothetical protein [Candidatus Lokiarchaeota archaeon]
MDREAFYKYLFLIAGIYNIAVAVPMLLAYPFMLPVLGLSLPNYTLWMYLFFAYVIMFGGAFIWISTSLKEHKNLAVLGLIEKIISSILFINFVFSSGSIMLLIFGLIDLVFAVIFAEFLYNY